MTTEIMLVLALSALFVSLVFDYKLFMHCANLRTLLLAEYKRRDRMLEMLHQHSDRNDQLAYQVTVQNATITDQRARIEQLLQERFTKPVEE